MTRPARPSASFDWRLQALLAACNSLPIFGIAVVLAYVSLVGGVVTGGVLWFVGGAFVYLVLGYAILCLLIASNLYRQRNWARWAAIGVYTLAILLLMAIAHNPPHHPAIDRSDRPLWQIVFTALLWTSGKVLLMAESVLPYANAVGIAHLALRWRWLTTGVTSRDARTG